MMLVLRRYAFKMTWKPGKEHTIADLLSRHTRNCEQPEEPAAREPVFQLQKHESQCQRFETIDQVRDCPVTGALYVTIQRETERDKLLQQLSEVIKNGWPKDVTEVPESIRPWWTFRDELAILDGVVYKGPIVVIPTSMHRDMLKRLHVSHQGLEATLRRARQSMFWHGMAVDVKRQIANCKPCSRDAPEHKKETLLTQAVPNKPWRKVGMDIFTHSSIIYIVIVDYFSDYFEFKKLSDMSSVAVIEISKRCFARLGIPETVHSDNGPQFSAREFAIFSNEWDFQLTIRSPYHSQSNGKAESSVKMAKRNMTIHVHCTHHCTHGYCV